MSFVINNGQQFVSNLHKFTFLSHSWIHRHKPSCTIQIMKLKQWARLIPKHQL